MIFVQKRKKPRILRLSLLPSFRNSGGSVELFSAVLVFVDALAHVVGFLVELALVLLGQMAVVLGHVSLFIVLQTLLAPFETRGLSRRQFVVLHAVGDAVLLVLFALIDLVDARMSGIYLACAGPGSVVLLGSGGSKEHQTTHCKDCQRLHDFIGHVRVNPREEV